MILDKLFPHLRPRSAKLWWASSLLTFYGRNLIGAPKPEDIPEQAGPAYRKRLSETYFNIWTDRVPPTPEQVEKWMIGSLWTTQLRVEQEKSVAQTTFWVSAVLCTALVAGGAFISKSTSGLESWHQERKAAAAAMAEAEYREQRDELMTKWTTDAEGYDAQRCFDEAGKFRLAETREQRDQASAVERGCSDKAQNVAALGSTWSERECSKAGRQIAEAIVKGGQRTWADTLVFDRGCSSRFPEVVREMGDYLSANSK